MVTEARKEFQPEQYRSYLAIWARICLRKMEHLRAKLDSSDIVQEALLQAHVALREFRGSTDHEFAAWLRQILQNKLWDQKKYYERDKRDATREEALYETLSRSSIHFAKCLDRMIPANQSAAIDRIVRDDKARKLADALATLPEDQRTAIELHHLEGQSLQETAALMTRSPASVAGLLRRGLKALRCALGDGKTLV